MPLHRSSRFLNVFTVSAVTTDSGSLFQCVTTRWLKKFFSQFQSASSGVEFQLMSSCAVMLLIQCEIRNHATFHFPHPLSTSTSTSTIHNPHPLSTSTQSNPSIHFPFNSIYHTHTHHSHTSIIFHKIVLILLFPLILSH